MPTGIPDISQMVLREILAGKLVPFLGAGASLCSRSRTSSSSKPGTYPPSSQDLCNSLAHRFAYPSGSETPNLMHVSQYAEVFNGRVALYDELHKHFEPNYQPTVLHYFLANLRRTLIRKHLPFHPMLIVTTNYDTMLESAFDKANEPYDLVYYTADGKDKGLFKHIPYGGKEETIYKLNEYDKFPVKYGEIQRTIILKMHGHVNRAESAKDSYVITEDHYIDYLAYNDKVSPLPAILCQQLKLKHILFLGHSLNDWNLRVILRRVWADVEFDSRSWAIQLDPTAIDQELWRRRNVIVFPSDLVSFVANLRASFSGYKPG